MMLKSEKCKPCESGTGKLTTAEIVALLGEVKDWEWKELVIFKRLKFKNFVKALAFVNNVGKIAESSGHHPDISFGWGYAEITISTHSVGGLTRNDFILAAQIDCLII